MKQLLKLSSIIHKIQIKNKTSLPELSMSVRLTFFSGWNRRDFHGSHLMIICVIKSSPKHRNETIFLFLLILMTDFPMIIFPSFQSLVLWLLIELSSAHGFWRSLKCKVCITAAHTQINLPLTKLFPLRRLLVPQYAVSGGIVGQTVDILVANWS